MKNWKSFAYILVVLGLLSGCASTPQRDINDPSNSLVIGYIDMEDAPTKAQSATLLQVAPPSEEPYWWMGVEDGMFYHDRLPVGSYQITKFFGSGFFAGDNNYNFSRQGNQTSVRISKPGIYFLGSYKYQKVKTGFFGPSQFSLEKTSKPTEADLLKRLLEKDEDIRNSNWAGKIRARLAELKL